VRRTICLQVNRVNNTVKSAMGFFHLFPIFKRFSSFCYTVVLFCEAKLIKCLCSTYIHKDDKDEGEKEGKTHSRPLVVGLNLRNPSRYSALRVNNDSAVNTFSKSLRFFIH